MPAAVVISNHANETMDTNIVPFDAKNTFQSRSVAVVDQQPQTKPVRAAQQNSSSILPTTNPSFSSVASTNPTSTSCNATNLVGRQKKHITLPLVFLFLLLVLVALFLAENNGSSKTNDNETNSVVSTKTQDSSPSSFHPTRTTNDNDSNNIDDFNGASTTFAPTSNPTFVAPTLDPPQDTEDPPDEEDTEDPPDAEDPPDTVNVPIVCTV